ncbi:MAG TPA: ABC transporter substrate-binding protein [Candidatus Halomonas stercoripullorum]|uniref:ABC transporter substrate-binding protein n=1 Tax=Candidatus Halomonas stercoripullorum TaxID=2838617 RepID=A0A9D2B6U1_9GAMM|nr:ABC transporter substrate-binding protein [Candidatus Halomonas stercoripullorum]
MLQQQFESLEQRTIDALDSLRHYRARLQELETRLAESEAQRLELTEENRELDEQNRELEEDNARLRERLRSGEPAPAFPAPPRRAQGLAALIGQRLEAPPAASVPAPAAEAPAPMPAPPPPAATRDTPQGQLAIEQAPSAEALLQQWYQRYPNAFFKGHTRPLKVGIHQDLAAHEPWPEKLLRRALAGYVNLPRYLKAVREGAERIDLEGKPDGNVDAQAAEHAKRKLERLQKAQRERGQIPQSGKQRSNGKRDQANAKGAAPTAKPQTNPQRPLKGQEAPANKPDSAPAKPMSMQEKLAALQAKHSGKR